MSEPNKNTEEKKNESTTSPFLRIFALFGIILIAGLYILSLVASLSDWDNAFGIFLGAMAATIFVPIMIHFIRIFKPKD